MGNDFYRKLGGAFLIAAGLLYAIERIGTKVADSIVLAGFYSGNMSGAVPQVGDAGFFDNLFVPVLTFVGVLLFVYGFPKK